MAVKNYESKNSYLSSVEEEKKKSDDFYQHQ